MLNRAQLRVLLTLVALLMSVAAAARAQPAPKTPALRPPAVPLVAVDPYFSIWSPADRLTDAATVHWTGRPHPLNSFVRVDGEPFRIMGATPADTAAMPQTSLAVHPTRTVYTFADKRIRITLTFVTPALPWDLDLLSRPITYLSWDVLSADGKPHQVQLYVDCGAEIAVNTPDQSVGLDYPVVEGLSVARMGTGDQPVLTRRGDDVRIDWGYGYLATPSAPGAVVTGGNGGRMRRAFVTGTALSAPAGPVAPAPVTESRVVGHRDGRSDACHTLGDAGL